MIGCRVTSISASGVRHDLDQAALGEHQRCAGDSRAAAGGGSTAAGAGDRDGRLRCGEWSVVVMPPPSVESVVSSSVAPWPVRVRKTSSRLGRCRDSSVTRDAARRPAGRRVAASASSSVTGTVSSSRPVACGSVAGDLGAGCRATSSSRAGSVGRTAMRWPPIDPLEPVRGVVRDDPAVVDDADLVGERVGLVEVLRGQQHGRAVGDEPAHDVPHVLALGRVEAGGRLVEEDHGRAGRPGWRPGRAGGACRRSRSWPSGSAASVRSNHSSSSRGAGLGVAGRSG